MMIDDYDDILALGAAWLAGYVVSCWHKGKRWPASCAR